MSLPPTDQPFADEEEDRKRKAEIEDMMRWQRESYFRNEPLQQEYRDLVGRIADNEKARRGDNAAHEPEPASFDMAPQPSQERRQASAVCASDDPGASEKPNFVRVADADVPTAGFKTGARRRLISPELQVSASGTVLRPAERIFDFDKYAGEVDQFATSKGIKGTIIFKGKPVDTDPLANNAFAHAAMSALYAYDKGSGISKFVGDARETRNHLEDSTYHAFRRLKDKLTGQIGDLLENEKERSARIDIYKDLFNNSIGREIGAAARQAGLPRSEVLNEVFEALKIGKLITDQYVDPRVDRNFDGNPQHYSPPSKVGR
jgi:hypothetical protein